MEVLYHIRLYFVGIFPYMTIVFKTQNPCPGIPESQIPLWGKYTRPGQRLRFANLKMTILLVGKYRILPDFTQL